MNKLLCSCLIILTCATTIKATEVKVPVIWNSKSSGIKQLGFYKDNDKYVWAVVSDHLKNISAKKQLSVCFYLDSDNDKKTGRFPRVAGYDLQFNVILAPVQKISLMSWSAKHPTRLPAYPDDYIFTVKSNVLYLAIKKSIFDKHQIHEMHTLRVVLNGYPAASLSVKSKASTDKTIAPPMNFIRFGENVSIRKKSPYAEIISDNGEVKVWNSFMERYEPREKFPENNKKIKILKMRVARGEAESLQIGLTTAEAPQKISLTASGLTSADGSEISSSQIEIEYLGYIIDAYGKRYGDVLLPNYQPEDALNNFILLTVNVPADANAGIYRGSLNLKVNGKINFNIPLSLRVYDFSLPAIPSFITAFCCKPSYVTEFFRKSDRKITSQKINTQMIAMRQLSKKYKIGPRFLNGGPKLRIENNKLQINLKPFDKALYEFFKIDKFPGFQMTSFQFGSHGKMYTREPFFDKNNPPDVDNPVFQKLWPQYTKAIYNRLKKLNYLDRTLFVIWDEPYDNSWHEIKILSKLSKQGAPEIQLGVFIGHYEPKIADSIDIWLTPADRMGGLYKQGAKRKIWLYNDSRMGSFTNPASDIRGCFWQAWEYKLQGFLNSEVDNWNWGWPKSSDKYQNFSPTHMWFYPNLNGGKPLASLRLALIRDGIEDYEYLKLFAAKLAEAKAKNHPGLKEAEALSLELQKVMPKLNKQKKIDFKMESIVILNEWRNKIAEQIVKLQK